MIYIYISNRFNVNIDSFVSLDENKHIDIQSDIQLKSFGNTIINSSSKSIYHVNWIESKYKSMNNSIPSVYTIPLNDMNINSILHLQFIGICVSPGIIGGIASLEESIEHLTFPLHLMKQDNSNNQGNSLEQGITINIHDDITQIMKQYELKVKDEITWYYDKILQDINDNEAQLLIESEEQIKKRELALRYVMKIV